jgi:hypothetical protein
MTYQNWTQEDINYLTRSIAGNKIKAVTKCLPIKKNPRLDEFTDEFYWNFKEELTTMLLKLPIKYAKEEILPY